MRGSSGAALPSNSSCIYSYCGPIVPFPSHKNLPSSLEKGAIYTAHDWSNTVYYPRKTNDSSSLTSSRTKIIFIKSECPFTTERSNVCQREQV